MKFTEVKTLKHLLKEYGMSSGQPTAVGSQKTGDNAKTNSVASPTTQKATPKKDLGSPTTTQGLGNAPEQLPTFTPVKAGDLDVDSEYNDKDGNPIGTVISKVGDNPNPDKVVVQDKKGEYQLLDPKDEVHTLVDEGKLGTLVKKTQSGIKFRSRDNQGVKKLARKNKLSEQGKEQIFEINFNKKEIGQAALEAPIKCGFEAESVWTEVYQSDDNYGSLESWYEIEDALADQVGRSAVDTVEEAYREWISEIAYDLEHDIINDMVSDRKEDEDYLNDFVEDALSEDDIEEYKENYLDGMDADQLEEYEDWDFIAWGRQYTEEEREDEFLEWLAETIRESGEAMDQAFGDAESDNSMDEWASKEYGSWEELLREFDYYISDPDSAGGGLEEVSEELYQWIKTKSQFNNYPEYGQYGTTDTLTSWAVEDDSSIDVDSGTGAEIISPVFDSPKEMLNEMKSLFVFMDENAVETNHSTGLHVTMSWQGKKEIAGDGPNALKLAMLLGDKYLLSTFGRENNSYAKSHLPKLQRYAAELKADPNNVKSIKNIEKILSKGIDSNKFSSIHFKGEKDRETGRQLIEFRIGGGSDYHMDFNNVAKAVIRYATTMQAGYTTEGEGAYTKDYAKALFRFISKLDQISVDDDERTKSRFEQDHVAVDVLKGFFNKDNYVESMFILASAFNNLNRYKMLKARKPGLKEDVESDSEKASLLKTAQEKFAKGIAQAGYDLNQNLNRDVVSAKGIGVLRNTLKEFELTYETLASLIMKSYSDLFTSGRRNVQLTDQAVLERVQNGVGRLFKKEVLELPEFISGPQLEKLASGMWNAINSGNIDKENKEFVKKLSAVYPNHSESLISDLWKDQMSQESFKAQWKDFFAGIRNGSYGRGPNSGRWFDVGEPINEKGYKDFITYLKKFKPYTEPLGYKVNPTISSDDGYRDSWLSKFMVKYRSRWDELDRIKDTDLQLYLDSIKAIGSSLQKLVSANKTDDEYMGELHPELVGTDLENVRDGIKFFGISGYNLERLEDMVKELTVGPVTPRFEDDSIAHSLKNFVQSYLRDSFDNYYDRKEQKDGFYKMGPVPEIIKDRTTAIKNFMVDFDKVTQKLGFDSQQDQIDNKMRVDKKDQKFTKKNANTVVEVPSFTFAGNMYVSKNFMLELEAFTPRQIRSRLVFTALNRRPEDANYVSDYDSAILMPTSHLSIANEVLEQGKSTNHLGTWREESAKKIRDAFRKKYRTGIEQFFDQYVSTNEDGIKKKLQQKGVVFDNGSLGDGREGMKGLGDIPLLPRKEINSKFGEPFEISASAAWQINNPQLSKKANAETDKQREKGALPRKLAKAAGIDPQDGSSSNGIASKTNWETLADHLGIERGVNEQGVELLRVIYNRFDGNHEWRPGTDAGGSNVIGLARWAAAVKEAEKYIKDNYIISDGNYKFKNADGTIERDWNATSDSGGPSEQDYTKARERYFMFNSMMEMGMQNYLGLNSVNNLVSFLNNNDNDEDFKANVLNTMRTNYVNGGSAYPTFQTALAAARMNSESVFTKFDALPLQEQLDVLSKVNKTKIDKLYETIEASQDMAALLKELPKEKKKSKKVKEDATPNNDAVVVINKLLADHFPVSDLKKQMLAFTAIPVPNMLNDFKRLRSEAGDDACARGIVRGYANTLGPDVKDKLNINEWSKSHVRSLLEAKGIMGRVLGDRFQKGNDQLEFQRVDLYPQEEMQFPDAESRDAFITATELELHSQIEWTNTPNNGSLAFGIATLTDPMLDDKPTYWGRYFKQKTADMMGKWSNGQVPLGWKLQTAGAMKLDIGIDPQHLIKTDDPFNGVENVIQAVKKNSAGNELSEILVNALETIHTQEHPVFPGQINNLPALRDYFGEIMGPVALMSEMVGGQADDAKNDLLKGQPWGSCSIFWPMAMNAPLVDSYFTAPDGTRVGISSKGGKGAKASVKNIADAIAKAPQEMINQYATTVKIINVVQSNSAKDGPFRLAELYKALPQGLEEEINSYIQQGKQDYAGLSQAATELFNYGTPRQDVAGFNTGYAMLALLAKKVTRLINESGPEFGQGCVAFLNQSSIVQLYCKMGKMGDDARVTGWEAVYPPNFQGTVEIDGSKNYYSSRIGGKFAFGFK